MALIDVRPEEVALANVLTYPEVKTPAILETISPEWADVICIKAQRLAYFGDSYPYQKGHGLIARAESVADADFLTTKFEGDFTLGRDHYGAADFHFTLYSRQNGYPSLASRGMIHFRDEPGGKAESIYFEPAKVEASTFTPDKADNRRRGVNGKWSPRQAVTPEEAERIENFLDATINKKFGEALVNILLKNNLKK